MSINYDILQDFLRCNKNIKLKFRENSNILDVIIFNDVILSLELSNNNIEEHSDMIYNSITNLDGITMYIPKIYLK
ncbi:hypothetical protein [Clostridium sp. CCUG 7971]|uniref:hypothetical protein n=1 Tax=Clostridium sp. CCUG 7971 TaxID=2811414 RepID=UPI001ABA52B7|nr:hypothetical protein [Clostridium sp. CCUG 7971]MBO3443994.1 hypothetical protein [Clostridium sp. CCUG 7971]